MRQLCHVSGMIILICCLMTIGIQANAQNFVNQNHTYVETIKSVQFGLPGLQTGFPIVNLQQGILSLEFDEIGDQPRYLRYRIRHCNRDWEISDLAEMEYLDGFNNEEIRQYALSVSTRVPYVHYRLSLPNQQTRWTKSGNYLLHIYDEDTDEPLITRRFMVVDPIMKVSANLSRPVDVSKIQSHHEVDFIVDHKDIRISNPQIEIKAVILQNGRWDNAITEIEPFQILPERLSFDYQDQLVFPAGKQFRHADLRSLRFPSNEVNEIKEYEDAFEVRMKQDEKRTFQDYHSERDLNGGFIIESKDNNRDIRVEGEYAFVVFSLKSAQPLYDHHIYLFGGFTDWEVKDEFIMDYDERYGYLGEALLKQGFYDYQYVAVSKEGNEMDPSMLEGDWHETENYYTILIYYRPFGERYDRLVAVQTLSER